MHLVADPVAAAAGWFARLRAPGAGRREQAALDGWRAENTANDAAYADIQALWDEIGAHAVEDPIMDLRREALALAPVRPERSWRNYGAVAAALIAVIALSVTFFGREAAIPRSGAAEIAALPSPGTDHSLYRTQVGERSTVRLGDGSIVQLNTDSVVRVAYSERERHIELIRGEALFEVAKDAGRAFVVETGGERVIAHGTQFNVRRRDTGIEVTLIEGKVSVERDRGFLRGREIAMLAPGQQLIASDVGGDFTVRGADTARVSFWREGRVSFDGEPLSAVVAEINRYSARKLEIADPSLGELRVSGTFKTGSPDTFVAALAASFPVERSYDARDNRIALTWADGAPVKPQATTGN
ncbi:FecR family protein [Sphingomonas sp.]|uniref:FecR family protein n=1 Tax=Sphingomonas sp. TaxID=28214 RepID=UPI002DD645BB|nr:FecR domain-containing protein [Sphingomonas sp.]